MKRSIASTSACARRCEPSGSSPKLTPRRNRAASLAVAAALVAAVASGAPAPKPAAPANPVATKKDDATKPDDAATKKDDAATKKDDAATKKDEAATKKDDAASGDEPAKPVPVEPLPEPSTYRQSPSSVPEPTPAGRYWTVEFGADTGLIKRPASGDGVHDSVGVVFGGHARVKVLPWLDARLGARVESAPTSFDDGALGLPRGTHIDDPGPRRVYLSLAAEPTWSPIPRLELWAGAGIAWGRTTAATLHASGNEVLTVPTRAAVFVEVPLSLGVRYEFLPHWLVVNLSVTVGFPSNQSGGLLGAYRTPGKDGALVTVGGFPELGTSVLGLAGVGVLL